MRYYSRHSVVNNLFVRIIVLIIVLSVFFGLYGSSGNASDYEWDDDWVQDRVVPICYMLPSYVGSVKRSLDQINPSQEELEEMFPTMRLGGIWAPSSCKPRYSIGVVVPITGNQSASLNVFLRNIIPFLQRTKVQFKIVVVNQEGTNNDTFKTGLLYNIGQEHLVGVGINCSIFHDVNLIPLHDMNIYKCNQENAVQLCSSILDLHLQRGFFGAAALTAIQFRKINGFPNTEYPTQEVQTRLKVVGLKLKQSDYILGRYWAPNKYKEDLLALTKIEPKTIPNDVARRRMFTDGYNTSTHSQNILSISTDTKLLYTRINVIFK